jgi:hypothetical protein
MTVTFRSTGHAAYFDRLDLLIRSTIVLVRIEIGMSTALDGILMTYVYRINTPAKDVGGGCCLGPG